MIDLLYLSYDEAVPTDDYWDMGTLKRLFAGQLWDAVCLPEFNRVKSFEALNEGGVIVFPARNQIKYLDQLNRDLKRLKWVVLILTGDEASEFPAKLIEHPNMRIWQMSPAPKTYVEGARKIGSGVPPQGYEWLPQYKEDAENRPVDYFFAGQLTHSRRQIVKKELDALEEFKFNNHLEGVTHYSEGFTQGLPPEYYYKGLAAAKTVVCPSGAINPESFRLFEALEAGCVPILDAFSPEMEYTDFWTWFFGEEPPFPVYTSGEQIRGYIQDSVDKYPVLNNRVFGWWQAKKRQMAYWLRDDIAAVTSFSRDTTQLKNMVTVIVPSSPIPAHPSTEMIEKTIADIRVHLPDCEILITVDGIRGEQDHYREKYDEYKKRLLWLANNVWHNVLPIIFEEHQHQASMAREVLKMVETPTVLYVEHDTPLTPDRPIDWQACVKTIMDGTANIIRFAHESKILDEHQHLFFETEEHHGISLTKTQQWSQRPHLASTAFYRNVISTYFHPESKTMIEDVMHQIVEMDMARGGRQAWFNWRIWLYNNPDADGSILRSYNLDGRQDDPKYDMQIVPVEGKQMADIKQELVALAKSHPVPSEIKLERRMKRLERMERFYDEKIAEAPEKQALMFNGFVSALVYAMTIIKMYRKLTKQLAELAQEATSNEDSNRL